VKDAFGNAKNQALDNCGSSGEITPGKHRTRRLTYESKRGTRIQTSPHNYPPFRKDPSQTPSARKKARLDLKTGLILGLRRGKGQDDLDSVRGVSTMQKSLPFDVELTTIFRVQTA
jgi:hypothetical protein